MLHLKFKFFVYVSLVSFFFYVNVEVCVSTKVSILQSIKIKGLLRMWLKLDASLCEIYDRFLMKCFVARLNVSLCEVECNYFSFIECGFVFDKVECKFDVWCV
jgi:hypothetical protein